MIDLGTIPDAQDGYQVAVIVAVLAYLAFKAWLDSGRTKQTNAAVKETSSAVSTIEAQLTTTNGGSHVKDQLNRIEAKVDGVEVKVDGVDVRVTELEGQIPGAPVAAIGEDADNPDDLAGERLPDEDVYEEGEVE